MDLMNRLALLALLLTAQENRSFELELRSRQDTKGALWEASKTAVIVCDMWDVHTCRNATRRVAEMAPRANAFVKAARAKGALIVHCPSDTMKFYEWSAGRKLAQEAPASKAPEPIQGRRLEPEREGKLPIDDSDWCDDEPSCPIQKKGPWPWTRQHEAIEILEGDAVSDQGQEIHNLFEQRGIRNVFVLGVHTNMCVLGRSFGIRQQVRLGRNVALVRDLTDCLYNPKKPPQVTHDRGTELMIEHIERFWCPSILSTQVTGATAK